MTRCYAVNSSYDYDTEIQPSFFDGAACGLYTSSTLDESHDSLLELLNVMSLHQRTNPSSVLVLYNAELTQRGIFSLRVVRVSQKYLDLEQQGRITAEKCADAGLSPTEMFEDVHFFIHNSHLVTAYMFSLTSDPKLSAMMASHQQTLNPAPTAVSHQLLERLIEKGKTSNSPPLLDLYTASLERFQRETTYIQRQKADYTKRVEDIQIENQRRARSRLGLLNIPEQPQLNDPSLQDIQLYSVRIENVAQDLALVTELAHHKQSLLKKFITQEGQFVIE